MASKYIELKKLRHLPMTGNPALARFQITRKLLSMFITTCLEANFRPLQSTRIYRRLAHLLGRWSNCPRSSL